jgi:hypothetical protein
MTPARIVATMIAVVAAVIALTAYTWVQMGGTFAISWHGILAMVLGVGLSLALGIGLMALVFYSNRSGHDDEVGRHDP